MIHVKHFDLALSDDDSRETLQNVAFGAFHVKLIFHN